MDIQTLINSIINGEVSADAQSRLVSAIQRRREFERNKVINLNKATFDEGDKATLTGLRPARINGLEVTINRIRQVKAEVKMPVDWRAGKHSGRTIIVPLNCLKRVV
jgi:hypothetical protein